MKLQVQFSLAGSAWELKSWWDLLTFIQNIAMLRGLFVNLIFAIIARILCGNHLKFKFSHKHSMLFYTESSPPDSKCLTGSDGVKEWWSEIGPPLQLGKLIFSKLKMKDMTDALASVCHLLATALPRRVNYTLNFTSNCHCLRGSLFFPPQKVVGEHQQLMLSTPLAKTRIWTHFVG